MKKNPNKLCKNVASSVSAALRCTGILLMFAITTLFISCEKSKLPLFNEPASIYFTQVAEMDENKRRTSVDVKFMHIVGSYDTVRIPVSVMGNLANYDRPISVVANTDSVVFRDTVIDPETGLDVIITSVWRPTTAKEGVHYRILDNLSYIPANSVTGYATVLATRATDIEDKQEVRLALKLKPNVHFNTDFDSIMNNITQRWMRNVLEYYVYVSDEITMPVLWRQQYVLERWGSYSRVKYELILREDIGRMPACFWDQKCKVDDREAYVADIDPVTFTLRRYLQELSCNDIWLLDERGRLMDDVQGFWETRNATCAELRQSPTKIVSIEEIKMLQQTQRNCLPNNQEQNP
jgi:hypothetical protein